MLAFAMGQLLEIRRHSARRADGELSQEGVDLARGLGSRLGPFARVVTSPVSRAVHTAVAMGFAVDAQHAGLAMPPAEIEAGCGEARRFADVALAMRRSASIASFAQAQAALWGMLLQELGWGASLLVISHAVTIELGVVVALGGPGAALVEQLGAGLGYCEGVRLVYDPEGGRFGELELLRVRAPR